MASRRARTRSRDPEEDASRVRSAVPLWLCAGLMSLSVVLGGATRDGFLADSILQFAAVPLLVAAGMSLWMKRNVSEGSGTLLVATALLLVPALQLIPMPAFLWSSLPGREVFARTYDTIGMEQPWLPLSLSQEATLQSLFSLFPPLALFLSAVLLGWTDRRRLTLVLLSLGVLSLLLGMAQFSAGPKSPLRPFEFTNKDVAVGFFANSNHFACFLAMLTPLAGAWMIALLLKWSRTRSFARTGIGSFLVLASFVPLVILELFAQTLTQSRAGIVLAALSIFGTFSLMIPYLRSMFRSRLRRRLYAVAIVGAVLMGSLLVYRFVPTLAPEQVDEARYAIATNTLNAAWHYAPFGSGIGTFVPIYEMFEPLEQVRYAYVNRAHNDLAELALESGLFGLVILVGLLVWWTRNIVAAWKRPIPEKDEIDHLLPLAASIMLPLPLLHSLLDYPLRTASVAAMLAIASALLVPPPGRPRKALAPS